MPAKKFTHCGIVATRNPDGSFNESHSFGDDGTVSDGVVNVFYEAYKRYLNACKEYEKNSGGKQ